MANNKIQFKRTSVSGRTPNTTVSTNNAFIDAGEISFNITDKKAFSSNGSALFEIGGNLSNIQVTGNSVLNGIIANGSIGTSAQVLASNGSSTYWTTRVFSVSTANGLSGGTITSTGTIGLVTNTGLVVNATGLFVNSSYINTISSNNASYLLDRTWASPGAIGSTTANTGAFTSLSVGANVSINTTSISVGNTFIANSSVKSGLFFTGTSANSTLTTGRVTLNTAQYRNSGSGITGAIVFSAESTLFTIMHQHHIRGHLYNGEIIDFIVQGYRVTASSWGGLKKINLGSVEVQVRFGVTPAGQAAIILGDVSSTWDWPHIAIVESLFSHSNIVDDYGKNWSASLITDLSLFTDITSTIPDSAITGNLDSTSLTGLIPYATVPTNIVNTTNAFTISGVHTHTANTGLRGVIANGSIGSAGQVLTSNATSTYWSTPTTGTITNIATGNGISGGPITSTGTLNLIANTGVVVNATGIFVNSAYINTISSNNSSFLGGLVSTGYQTTAGLSGNVATLTANNSTYAFSKTEGNLNVNNSSTSNNASYLLGRTWVAPGAIGSTTANTGAFTTVTATNISGANAQLNIISATKLYPKAINIDTTNLFPDPEMEDANCYSGDTFSLSTVAADGGTSLKQLQIASNTDAKNVYSVSFQLDPSKYYRVSAKLEHSGSGSGGPYLYLVTYSDNDATVEIEQHPIFTSASSTTPTYRSNTALVSSSARRGKLLFQKYAGLGRNALWSEPRIQKIETEFVNANVSGNLSVTGITSLTSNTTISALVANTALGTNGQFLVSNSSGGLYWKTQHPYLTGDLIINDFSNVQFINTFLTLHAGKTIFISPGTYTLETLVNGANSTYHGDVVNIPANTHLVGLGDVIIRPTDPFRGAFSMIQADGASIENITVDFTYSTARHSSDFLYNSDSVNDLDDYWWKRDYYANGQLLASNGSYTGSTATAAAGPFQTWVTEFNSTHYANTQWKFYNNANYQLATPTSGQGIKDIWDPTSFANANATSKNCGLYIENSNNISIIDFNANNCVVGINIQGGNSSVGTSQSSNIYINKLKMGADVEFGLLAKKVDHVVIDSVISTVPGINRNHAEPHIIYFSNEPTRGEKSTNITVKSMQVSNYRKGSTFKTKYVEGLTIGSYVGSSIQTALSLNGNNITIDSINVNDQLYGRIYSDDVLPDLTAKYKDAPVYLINMNDVSDLHIGSITVEQRPSKLNVYYNERAENLRSSYLTYNNYSELEGLDDLIKVMDIENGQRITVGTYGIKSARLSEGTPQIRLRRVSDSYFGSGSYIDVGRNYLKESNTIAFDSTSASVVNVTSNYIFFTNPFSDGDVVSYSANGGTAIGGLTDVYSYFIINSNTSAVQLSTANNGTSINITSLGVGTTHSFTRSKATPKLFELSSSTSDGGSSDRNTFDTPRLYNSYWGDISSGSSDNSITIDPVSINPYYQEDVTVSYSSSYGDNNKINLINNKRSFTIDASSLTLDSGEYVDNIQTRDKVKFYLNKYYQTTMNQEESSSQLDHVFKIGDSITIGSRTYTFSNSVVNTDTILLHAWPFVNTAISNTAAIDITNNFFPINKNRKLTDKDIVRYTTTGTAIGGLSNNSYYFVTGANTSGVKLANTTHITTPIDFTSVGTGTHTLNKNDLVTGEKLINRLEAAITNTNYDTYGQGTIYNNGGLIHSQVDAIASGVELLIVGNVKGELNPAVTVSANIANQNILLGPLYGSDGNIVNSNGVSVVYGSDIGSWSGSELSGGGLADSTQFYSFRTYDTTTANVVITLPDLSNSDLGAWISVRKSSDLNVLKVKSLDGVLLGYVKYDGDIVDIRVDDNNEYILDIRPWWLTTSSAIHIESNTAWNARSLNLNGDKVTYTIPAGAEVTGLDFKSDGTRAYTVSDSGNLIRSYELGTAWDISTAVVNTNTFDTGTQETNPRGITWKDDGTRIYITGYNIDKVFEYVAATPWVANNTNLTLVGNVTTTTTSPRDVKFSNTGSKMYILDKSSPRSILEYQLSTAWSCNSANLTSVSSFNFEFVGETTPEGMFFSPDGRKVYIVGTDYKKLDEFVMTTAWQVNSAVMVTSSLGTFSNTVTGIYVKSDGTRLFAAVGDVTTSGEIHQYEFEPFTIDGHKVWTSYNDGSGSGLNADLLDGKDWVSPGAIGSNTPNSAIFTTINIASSSVFANSTQFRLSNTIGIVANNSLGLANDVLVSNGSAVYWSSRVSSVSTGNGVTGGTITSTGTISVVANTGLIANTTGLFVNSAYVNTISANNSSFLGGLVSTGYQTTAGLSANVATLTSNNSSYLLGQTWVSPGAIGSTTANTINASSIGVGANVISNSIGITIGNSTVNSIMLQTGLYLSNSTSNTRLTIPSNSQYSATNVFLHANGTWLAPSAYAYTAPTITVLVNDPNGESLTASNGQAYIPIPLSINNYSLASTIATVVNASSSGNVSIQLYNVTQNRNMLSTELTIDNNEVSSTTSGIPAVINSAASSVLTGDIISVQVTQAGTGVKGLMVNMTYQTVITATSTYTPTIIKYVTDPYGDDLIVGDGQAYIPISPDINGMRLSSVVATVSNASSSGIPTIQLRNSTTGIDLLSTKVTIDVGETSSLTATTPPVVNSSAATFATGNLLAVDVDIAGTGTKGLILTLTFGL